MTNFYVIPNTYFTFTTNFLVSMVEFGSHERQYSSVNVSTPAVFPLNFQTSFPPTPVLPSAALSYV